MRVSVRPTIKGRVQVAVPNLTRGQAQQRADLFDVDSYTIELDLTDGGGKPGDTTFRSTTTVRFRCARPGESSWIDLIATEVRRAVLNGVELDVSGYRAEDGVALPELSAINELVERCLGPIARNRKGLLSADKANREEEVWRAAGFDGPQRIEVPGEVVERTSDQIVAGIFSLSSSTPHLFGERREAFESDLRRLLHDANPSGNFSEQMREIAADIWRSSEG